MDTATDSRYRETSERLALLLIAQPREGWEEEFEELIRREVESTFRRLYAQARVFMV